MRKGIFYAFILSVAALAVGAIIGEPLFTKAMFFLALGFGMVSLFIFIRQTYIETTRVTRTLKSEANKAYNRFRLSYRLETLELSHGADQLKAGEKKLKVLLRLIQRRFADSSLTAVRFRQEVAAYAQKIVHNLEMAISHKESMTSLDPAVWREQLHRLRKAGAPPYMKSVQEIQQHLNIYDQMSMKYKALLAENDELLAQMDQAILALHQENDQLFAENSSGSLLGKDAFIPKFLHY